MLKSLQADSFPDMANKKQLEKEIDYWLKKDDLKSKQRAKREWYKGSDKNTKFFHACAT